MRTAKESLFNLLKARSVKLGAITLSSGAKSDFYIDVRLTSMCAEGYHLIGEVLREAMETLEFEAIGGPETGAIPLVGAALNAWRPQKAMLEGFWVRRTPKLHGSQKLIEGNLQPGMRVVIIDDVITSGNSIVKAIDAVRIHGCDVVGVVGLVDRLAGAKQLLMERGIPTYVRTFTIKDFEPVFISTRLQNPEREREEAAC